MAGQIISQQEGGRNDQDRVFLRDWHVQRQHAQADEVLTPIGVQIDRGERTGRGGNPRPDRTDANHVVGRDREIVLGRDIEQGDGSVPQPSDIELIVFDNREIIIIDRVGIDQQPIVLDREPEEIE